jgi:hypothetical protein
MDALLLPRYVVSLKHLLDLVENGLGDEGLVIALVLSPVERDVAEGLPITQQLGDIGVGERTAAPLTPVGYDAAG